MQKTPVKGLHTRPRGLWNERTRVDPGIRHELAEKRARLEQLAALSRGKTAEISELLKAKADEQARLRDRLNAAYKKTQAPAHRKALARARMDLENHLHRTMRELGLRNAELKELRREADCISEHLRKLER